MLSVATEGGSDVAMLKARALQMMALSYRARSVCQRRFVLARRSIA